MDVGADMIRPTVEYYEFAENRCGIATFCRRADIIRPYIHEIRKEMHYEHKFSGYDRNEGPHRGH